MRMAKLKSEIEVTCPCCRSSLVIDTNLGRVVSHREPERGDKPELHEASRILADQAAKREALFEQSVANEKGRDDALARRFEEALKQAHEAVEKDEDHHLYHTKGWCRELSIEALGMPAVLPPPEEVKNVETAIGASRAEQQRTAIL